MGFNSQRKLTALSSILTTPSKPSTLFRADAKLLTHPSGISVELQASMGGDVDIVNAARVSLGKESFRLMHLFGREFYAPDWLPESWSFLGAKDIGLINYLMREKHGSVFEMVQFKLRVRVPIFVQREWMRHRIGSFNEVSTRYVEFKPEFYVPEGVAWRRSVGKPGHYKLEPLSREIATEAARAYYLACDTAFDAYQSMLRRGVAREVARNVLPLCTFTEFIWSVNLRSLLNFLSLRTAPNALLEIQWAAGYVEQLIEPIVPEAMAAWRKHGKACP